LILAGDADRLARPAEAYALYNQVSAHGKLILFPGAGHMNLPESAPDLFKRTLLDFYREIAGSEQIGSSILRNKSG
jgi:pimeloyl-ACP methyl ester carboxylesterase